MFIHVTTLQIYFFKFMKTILNLNMFPIDFIYHIHLMSVFVFCITMGSDKLLFYESQFIITTEGVEYSIGVF